MVLYSLYLHWHSPACYDTALQLNGEWKKKAYDTSGLRSSRRPATRPLNTGLRDVKFALTDCSTNISYNHILLRCPVLKNHLLTRLLHLCSTELLALLNHSSKIPRQGSLVVTRLEWVLFKKGPTIEWRAGHVHRCVCQSEGFHVSNICRMVRSIHVRNSCLHRSVRLLK